VTGRDRAAAAVLLAFGLIALEEARKLRLGSIARPGPGFFPVLLAAAFSVVCLVLLVNAWRARDAARGTDPPLGSLKIVATMAALFVYAFALERVGFVVATFATENQQQDSSWLGLPDGGPYKEILNSSWPVFQVEFEQECTNGGYAASIRSGQMLKLPYVGAVVLERR